MKLRSWIGSVVIVVLLVLAVGVVWARSSALEQTDTAPLHSYVGIVTDSEDVFVAVVVDGENATVYICDGQAELDTVSKAEWFVGPEADNHIDITAESGNRVEVDVSLETATGTFTFTDGSVMNFTAVLLVGTGDVGLFRSEFTLGDTDYVGGWLVLPDGSVRGAVRDLETGELTPATFTHFQDRPDEGQ